MDSKFTKQVLHRAIDGSLCTTCAVLSNTSNRYFSLLSEESDANEQWLSRVDNAVEQGFLYENAEVEPWFPSAPIVGEQRLPQGRITVEQGLVSTRSVAVKNSYLRA